MKTTATISLILALSASASAFAQSGDMQGMKDKEMHCMDMKGMDMKNMDMEKCRNMMGSSDKASKEAAHETSGVVKKVDPKKGMVMLAHEPVASLNWPAMTMGFQVKERSLLEKMTVGKNVDVTFVKEGKNYVVTSVK